MAKKEKVFKGKFVKAVDAAECICPIMTSEPNRTVMCRGRLCMLWIDSKELKGDKVGCGSCGLLGAEQVIPNVAKKAQGT